MNRETILSQNQVNTPDEYAHYKRIRECPEYRMELQQLWIEAQMSFNQEALTFRLDSSSTEPIPALTKKVFLTPKEYDEFNQVRAEVTYLRGKVMELSKKKKEDTYTIGGEG